MRLVKPHAWVTFIRADDFFSQFSKFCFSPAFHTLHSVGVSFVLLHAGAHIYQGIKFWLM